MAKKEIARIKVGAREWALRRFEYDNAPLTAYHPTGLYSVEIDHEGDLSFANVDEHHSPCIPKLVLQHLIRDGIARKVFDL